MPLGMWFIFTAMFKKLILFIFLFSCLTGYSQFNSPTYRKVIGDTLWLKGANNKVYQLYAHGDTLVLNGVNLIMGGVLVYDTTSYWAKSANYLTPIGKNRVKVGEVFDSSGFPQQTNRMVLDPDHYRIIFSLNQRVGGSGPPPLQIQDSLIFVHPYPVDPIDFATLYSPGELNLGTKAHPIDTIHYTYLDPPISSGGDTTWHDDGYSAHKQTSKRDTVVIKSILTHTIGGADLEVENPITFKDTVILKKGKRLESGAGWIFGSDTSFTITDSLIWSGIDANRASLKLVRGRQVIMSLLNDPAPPAKT